jgi:hypothetical protein
MCYTPQKLTRLAHYSNDVATEATPTSVDAQAIVLSPTTAAPSGGDSREAGTRTAHPLSHSPYKFPRLTGMSDDFPHARTAAAVAAATTTRSTTTAADNRYVRGFSDMEVAVKATEVTAAAGALARTAGVIEAAAYTTAGVVGAAGTAATTTTASATSTSIITALRATDGSSLVEAPSKKKKQKRAGASKGKSHRNPAGHDQRATLAKQHSMDSTRDRRYL